MKKTLMIHEITDEVIQKAKAAHREGYEITLDDGLAQQFEARHELPPSTFFIAGALIDGWNAPLQKNRHDAGSVLPSEALAMAHIDGDLSAYMTFENLVELVAEGRHELGMHGYTHVKAAFLSPSDDFDKVVGSTKRWVLKLWDRVKAGNPGVREDLLTRMAKMSTIYLAPKGAKTIINGMNVTLEAEQNEMIELDVELAQEMFTALGVKAKKFCWPFNESAPEAHQTLVDAGIERIYGAERIDVEDYVMPEDR